MPKRGEALWLPLWCLPKVADVTAFEHPGPALMVGAKAGSSGWAFYREWKVPGEGGCAGCRGMVEDDLMLGMYYEQPEQASGGGGKAGKAGKEAAAGAAAAGATAEADAMAWELQALRLFRYRLQGSSSSGGDSNSGSGMGSGSGSASVQSRASPLQADQQPPALTPGQTLERLLQTDPAALRARHDELQSNMLIQAATPRTTGCNPTHPGCNPTHHGLQPHAPQAAAPCIAACNPMQHKVQPHACRRRGTGCSCDCRTACS